MVEAFSPPGHLLVLRPRRPEPTPPAHAVTPSSVRRARARLSASPLFAVAALVVGALILVAQSAAATQASYEIASLKQEQARLLAEQDQLHFQLAQAQAAYRVDSAAQALGLTRPGRWQYLSAGRSPIALNLEQHDHTRAVWTNVFAALSTLVGKPLRAPQAL